MVSASMPAVALQAAPLPAATAARAPSPSASACSSGRALARLVLMNSGWPPFPSRRQALWMQPPAKA
jgi:hypothetical protein